MRVREYVCTWHVKNIDKVLLSIGRFTHVYTFTLTEVGDILKTTCFLALRCLCVLLFLLGSKA